MTDHERRDEPPWQADLDYLSMSSSEMTAACGEDGMKWATAFCQFYRRLREEDATAGEPLSEPEPGWMVGWFANAIETACDSRGARQAAALVERDRELAETMGLLREIEENARPMTVVHDWAPVTPDWKRRARLLLAAYDALHAPAPAAPAKADDSHPTREDSR